MKTIKLKGTVKNYDKFIDFIDKQSFGYTIYDDKNKIEVDTVISKIIFKFKLTDKQKLI